MTYSFHNDCYQSLPWTTEKRNVVRKVLDRYETYANLKFIQIGDNSEIDIGAKQSANIQFNHRPLERATGVASYGGPVSVSTTHKDLTTRSAFFTLMHEVGHSLGAKHTFEGNNVLSYMEDHRGLSVLSYIGTRMDVDRWNLSLYDLAFVQYRYGVNPNARTGNDYLHGGKGADTFISSTVHSTVTSIALPISIRMRTTSSWH